jgi:hypothetical protein
LTKGFDIGEAFIIIIIIIIIIMMISSSPPSSCPPLLPHKVVLQRALRHSLGVGFDVAQVARVALLVLQEREIERGGG